MLWIIIIIILFSFFLRSIFHFKNKWVGIDTFHHLIEALSVKKNGIYSDIKNLIHTDKRYERYVKFYPPLLYVVLSVFPKKHHDKLRYFATILDISSMIILFLITNSIFGFEASVVSVLVYAIAPNAVLSCQTLSPKPLANIFLNMSLICLYYYYSSENIISLSFFVFFSFFVLMTHKITIQSLFAVVLASSIFFIDFLPVVCFFLSVGLAVLLTKGRYFETIKSHFETIKYYAKVGESGFHHVGSMNPMTPLFAFPFVILILFDSLTNGITNPFFYIWFFSVEALGFLWPLGAGYRHVYNAIFPGALIVGMVFGNSPVFWFCVLLSFAGIGFIYKNYKGSDRIFSKDFIKCCKWVEKESKKEDVLAVFPRSYWRAAVYFSDVKILSPGYDKDIFKKGEYNKIKINWIISNNKEKTKKYKEAKSFKNFHIFKYLKN